MRDEGDMIGSDKPTLHERIFRLENFLGMAHPGIPELEAAGQRPLNFDQRDYGDESTFDSAKYQQRRDEIYAETAWRRSLLDKVARHADRSVTQPSEPTALEDVISRINGSSERILNYAVNLEIVANRIMGELPRGTEEGSCGVEARPDGTLDHTYVALNVLDSAITRLHSVALRLERI